MIQICNNIQGLLKYNSCVLIETYCPGFCWLCSYPGLFHLVVPSVGSPLSPWLEEVSGDAGRDNSTLRHQSSGIASSGGSRLSWLQARVRNRPPALQIEPPGVVVADLFVLDNSWPPEKQEGVVACEMQCRGQGRTAATGVTQLERLSGKELGQGSHLVFSDGYKCLGLWLELDWKMGPRGDRT